MPMCNPPSLRRCRGRTRLIVRHPRRWLTVLPGREVATSRPPANERRQRCRVPSNSINSTHLLMRIRVIETVSNPEGPYRDLTVQVGPTVNSNRLSYKHPRPRALLPRLHILILTSGLSQPILSPTPPRQLLPIANIPLTEALFISNNNLLPINNLNKEARHPPTGRRYLSTGNILSPLLILPHRLIDNRQTCQILDILPARASNECRRSGLPLSRFPNNLSSRSSINLRLSSSSNSSSNKRRHLTHISSNSQLPLRRRRPINLKCTVLPRRLRPCRG